MPYHFANTFFFALVHLAVSIVAQQASLCRPFLLPIRPALCHLKTGVTIHSVHPASTALDKAEISGRFSHEKRKVLMMIWAMGLKVSDVCMWATGFSSLESCETTLPLIDSMPCNCNNAFARPARKLCRAYQCRSNNHQISLGRGRGFSAS